VRRTTRIGRTSRASHRRVHCRHAVRPVRHGSRPSARCRLACSRPGTFQDVAPLTLMTTASLRAARAVYPDGDWDDRGFGRRCCSMSTAMASPRQEWVGKSLRIGDVELSVTAPTAAIDHGFGADKQNPWRRMRKTRAPRSRPEVRPFSTRSCFASTLDSEGEGNPPTQRPHEHAGANNIEPVHQPCPVVTRRLGRRGRCRAAARPASQLAAPEGQTTLADALGTVVTAPDQLPGRVGVVTSDPVDQSAPGRPPDH